MKKMFLVAASVLTMLICFMLSASALPSGDIDKNGVVEASDARTALRNSVGLDKLDDIGVLRADMDGDGLITAADARLILRKSVGIKDAWLKVPSEAEKTIFERNLLIQARKFIVFKTDENGNTVKIGATKEFWNQIHFQKWCCIYTIDDVFRPTLQASGYSQSVVDKLCPERYDRDTLAKAIGNLVKIEGWPKWLVSEALFTYPVPSLFMDYYINSPDVCHVYFMHEYYDDIVEQKVYPANEADTLKYEPKIGDIVFMSNKNTTNVNGYLTIDHTAQIIELDEFGKFRCTEGSIVVSTEGDGKARVRERVYDYSDELGTYVWTGNPNIVVLAIVRPTIL